MALGPCQLLPGHSPACWKERGHNMPEIWVQEDMVYWGETNCISCLSPSSTIKEMVVIQGNHLFYASGDLCCCWLPLLCLLPKSGALRLIWCRHRISALGFRGGEKPICSTLPACSRSKAGLCWVSHHVLCHAVIGEVPLEPWLSHKEHSVTLGGGGLSGS